MKKKHIVLIVISAVIIILIITGVLVFKKINSNLKTLSAMQPADINLSAIADGSYDGSYSVFPVTVEVKVTVKDHIITAVDLIKHVNGKGKPAEVLTQKVVEKQSLDVDIISGATYSSKVIIKAIENALTKT